MNADVQKIIQEISYQIGRNRLALQGSCDGMATLKDRIDTLTTLLHFAQSVAEQSLKGDQAAYVDTAAEILATDVVRELSDAWGEDEDRKAAEDIRPIIRRTLAAVISTAASKSQTSEIKELDVIEVSKEIIDQISDGWGEEEDARAAGQITPLIRQSIRAAAGHMDLIDVQTLAARIVQELSEGWDKQVEINTVEEIKPILQRRLGLTLKPAEQAV